MKCTHIPLAILIFVAGSAAAAEPLEMPGPNWQRAEALLAGEQPGSREILSSLYGLARAGQGDALLREIIAIENAAALPEPARDRILFELATALGDFDPFLSGRQALDYLRERPPLARVPHEENPGLGVPLYNVRAAAAGSLAAWARLESPTHAGAAARAAEPLRDSESFLGFISAASGPEIAGHIRWAVEVFDPSELESIVLAVPRMADTATASLLIAELSPRLVFHPAVTDLMFDLLDHPGLGSSAALALARSGDESVLRRLSDVAATGNGIAARRAALAIGMSVGTGREP
jgi:hypothetical protein